MGTRVEDLQLEYRALMHAVQTGVALEMEQGSRDTEPKHLRVGINSALVDSAALAVLLIRKGILTKEEYFEALVDAARREVESYEDRLERKLGRRVKLA